jgi:hypothetical protein
LAARKSKENQEKKLGFPWILLAESGFINGLQRKKEKNPPPASLALEVARAGPVGGKDQSFCLLNTLDALCALQKNVP